jgi:hypothetical protein
MKKKTERRKEPLGPTDQNSQQQIITLKKKMKSEIKRPKTRMVEMHNSLIC